jgi:hypothetical protein
MQKANDYIAARLKSANHFVDEMLRLSKSPRTVRASRSSRREAGDYAKGAQQIAGRSREAIAVAGGGADAAARITKAE